MDLYLVGIGSRTDYVQVFGLVCRIEEIAYCKRRFIPIQEHVSIGKLSIRVKFKCGEVMFVGCR